MFTKEQLPLPAVTIQDDVKHVVELGRKMRSEIRPLIKLQSEMRLRRRIAFYYQLKDWLEEQHNNKANVPGIGEELNDIEDDLTTDQQKLEDAIQTMNENDEEEEEEEENKSVGGVVTDASSVDNQGESVASVIGNVFEDEGDLIEGEEEEDVDYDPEQYSRVQRELGEEAEYDELIEQEFDGTDTERLNKIMVLTERLGNLVLLSERSNSSISSYSTAEIRIVKERLRRLLRILNLYKGQYSKHLVEEDEEAKKEKSAAAYDAMTSSISANASMSGAGAFDAFLSQYNDKARSIDTVLAEKEDVQLNLMQRIDRLVNRYKEAAIEYKDESVNVAWDTAALMRKYTNQEDKPLIELSEERFITNKAVISDVEAKMREKAIVYTDLETSTNIITARILVMLYRAERMYWEVPGRTGPDSRNLKPYERTLIQQLRGRFLNDLLQVAKIRADVYEFWARQIVKSMIDAIDAKAPIGTPSMSDAEKRKFERTQLNDNNFQDAQTAIFFQQFLIQLQQSSASIGAVASSSSSSTSSSLSERREVGNSTITDMEHIAEDMLQQEIVKMQTQKRKIRLGLGSVLPAIASTATSGERQVIDLTNEELDDLEEEERLEREEEETNEMDEIVGKSDLDTIAQHYRTLEIVKQQWDDVRRADLSKYVKEAERLASEEKKSNEARRRLLKKQQESERKELAKQERERKVELNKVERKAKRAADDKKKRDDAKTARALEEKTAEGKLKWEVADRNAKRKKALNKAQNTMLKQKPAERLKLAETLIRKRLEETIYDDDKKMFALWANPQTITNLATASINLYSRQSTQFLIEVITDRTLHEFEQEVEAATSDISANNDNNNDDDDDENNNINAVKLSEIGLVISQLLQQNSVVEST